MKERVNLLPLALRAARWRRRAMLFWSSTGALVALVACVVGVGTALGATAASGERDQRKAIVDRERNIEQLRAQIERGGLELSKIEREYRVSKRIHAKPDWSVLVTLIAALAREEIAIEQCRLIETTIAAPRVTGRSTPLAKGAQDLQKPRLAFQLTLVGAARTQESVSGYVRRLEESGLFASTTLVQTRRRTLLSGDAVAFEIRCELLSQLEASR